MRNLGRYHQQVVHEENEEYSGDNRALGCTSIDRMQTGEEAVHSDGNGPIREETTNPVNESLIDTKHR